MRSRQLFRTLAMAAALAAPGLSYDHAHAQEGTVTGRVTAQAGGAALQGAGISVAGTARGVLTNAEGRYELRLPPGTYTLRAGMLGFATAEQSVRVVADQTVTADFVLETAPVMGEALIVTGSRTVRTNVETPVPVDVISSLEIRLAPQTEVNQILTRVAPSFNANHQTIADGSDHINPASLRGLGPDQVLVLVNGKRRHQSALVHVNGTFGRGTVGVDLNAIPTSSIERIEVLRDGAAAQYGSDAIAGVINIVLKNQTDRIETSFIGGVTGEGDGGQGKATVNYGFPVGERGFFNLSGEFMERGRTDRSEPWSSDIFPGISGATATDAELRRRGLSRADFSMKTGQSAATVGVTFYNTVVPLSTDAEFYSFGGFSQRDGEATGFYRLPNQEARVVPSIHPNGFLPEIHTNIQDFSTTAGVRGSRSGWDVDLSLSHGWNDLQYSIENSNNASLGAASPTIFDAGKLRFGQTTGNLDAVRLIDTGGALSSLSLVLGAEFRIENYQIVAGEPGSWQLGNGGTRPGIDFDTTRTGAPKEPGSQVFPGFQPSNEVNRFRNSIGAYAGFESRLTDRLLVDVGGRIENYSDFGSTVNGKVAARLEVTPSFALRGAASTGFRAPSLHQVWFNNVSIQFLIAPGTGTLEPSRVLTSNNQSPVTKAFGIPDLDEETSLNLSAGFTLRPAGGFSLTTDFYWIDIDNRVVLTSRFADSDPIVRQLLQPFRSQGVGAAQFFANSVDTRTKGLDIVGAYGMALGDGTLTLLASANFTETEVLATNVPAPLAQRFGAGNIERVRGLLFDREERNRLEDALPHVKGTLSARYELDRLRIAVRASHFGKIEYKPTDTRLDETFGAKTIFDIDVGYQLTNTARVSVGADNVFNTFPDRHTKDANLSSGRFPYSRRVTQFGMNGGFYFARVDLTF